MGNNFTPPPSEPAADELQIRNLSSFTYHGKVTPQRHRPPLEVSPSNVHGIVAVSDAMNAVLRPCQNMSAHELIRFVWLILLFLVYRLMQGDATYLEQDQELKQWMRAAFKDLLAVVRAHY